MAALGRIMKPAVRDLYDRNIQRQWIQGYGEPEHQFEQIYDVVNSTQEDERFSYISGLGRWSEKEYGKNVNFDSIFQGYDTTITPFTYSNGFTVEQEAVEDDPHALLSGQMANSLAQTGRETLEFLAAQPFNNCTATTYAAPWVGTSSNGDALALLSTIHPVLSGGVFSNCPATHVDLSIAALQAARTRMEKMINARGLPWAIESKKLVVPTESRWLAREILETPTTPYTANLTKNVVIDGLELVVWQWLNVGLGCWFLLGPKAGAYGSKGHMAKCIMRITPEFDRQNEFLSGDRQYKGRMRVGFGFPDSRGIDGSIGA